MIILSPKISNEVGKNNNCHAKVRQLSILPTSLDIFDKRHQHVGILYALIVSALQSTESADFSKYLLSNLSDRKMTSAKLFKDLMYPLW